MLTNPLLTYTTDNGLIDLINAATTFQFQLEFTLTAKIQLQIGQVRIV
jgi:hypothetical protein